MVGKECTECEYFDECYLIVYDHATITNYFNAIRRKDLCVNNKKVYYTEKS